MDDLIFNRDSPNCYYNTTDLNRVEEWCEYLANLLNGYSYQVNITVKTDWVMSDFPTEAEMERIRSNVNALKTACYSYTDIPENLDYMTYQKANDIEKILNEIDKILNYMGNDFMYCGVSNCGQDRIWQRRFRIGKMFVNQLYAIGQYASGDLLSMISTNSGAMISGKTSVLEITQLDVRDDIYAGIQSINASMQIIDGLVGA